MSAASTSRLWREGLELESRVPRLRTHSAGAFWCSCEEHDGGFCPCSRGKLAPIIAENCLWLKKTPAYVDAHPVMSGEGRAMWGRSCILREDVDDSEALNEAVVEIWESLPNPKDK